MERYFFPDSFLRQVSTAAANRKTLEDNESSKESDGDGGSSLVDSPDGLRGLAWLSLTGSAYRKGEERS